MRAEGLRSQEGTGLLHSVGYYTLNNLPDGDRSIVTGVDGQTEEEPEISAKKTTVMPDEWGDGPDDRIVLTTQPGLRYDLDIITVQAGSRIALTFNNDDDMVHNVVIVEPNSADQVGVAAMNLGLDADALEYVPHMNEVLYHSSMLQPGQVETIYFVAPNTPGEYEFVCTFPGHHISMRGILKVK